MPNRSSLYSLAAALLATGVACSADGTGSVASSEQGTDTPDAGPEVPASGSPGWVGRSRGTVPSGVEGSPSNEADAGAPDPQQPFIGTNDVIRGVKIVQVNWNGKAFGEPQIAEEMPDFYGDLVGSGYMASLNEYAGAGQDVAFWGSYNVTADVPPAVKDSDVQAMLSATFDSGGLLTPKASQYSYLSGAGTFRSNVVYAVHLPATVTSATDNAGNQACAASKGWCGYHHRASYQSTAYTYFVIPDYAPGGGVCGGQCNFTTAGWINDTTKVASHEVIETVTDPWGTGFAGLSNHGEIGDDPCNTLSLGTGQGYTTMPSRNGPAWLVQAPWSAQQNRCVTDASWSWDNEAYRSPGLAVVRGPWHMDMATIGGPSSTFGSGSVVEDQWDAANGGSDWGAKYRLPGVSDGTPASAVTMIARAPTQMDAFWVSAKDSLIHWDSWAAVPAQPNGSWSGAAPVGVAGKYTAPVGGQVAAVGRYPGHMDVFVAGTNGALVASWWDASTNRWATPWNLAPAATLANGAPVTVVASSPSHMDVLGVSASGQLMDIWYDDSTGWSPKGMQAIAGGLQKGAYVAAVASSPTHIDVFTTNPSGQVVDVWLDGSVNGGHWNNPVALAGLTTNPGAPLAAAGQGTTHLDVIAITPESGLMDAWYEWRLGGWQPAYNIVPPQLVRGGAGFFPGDRLQLVSQHRGRLDAFVATSGGVVLSTFWDAVTSPTWSTPSVVVRP